MDKLLAALKRNWRGHRFGKRLRLATSFPLSGPRSRLTYLLSLRAWWRSWPLDMFLLFATKQP
jgi:hypothetical protein